jgi:hypothetical protein
MRLLLPALFIVVIILPFLLQTVLRRVANNTRLARLHPLFEEVISSQAEAVTGEVEGKRGGRLMGLSFIGGGAGIGKRARPDAKSSVEFWAQCSGAVPFSIRGSAGVLLDREFEATSSQPEEFARLQSDSQFSGAVASLTAAGAESLIFPGRGRIVATFRPYRGELLEGETAGQVMNWLEQMAKAIEVETS